MLKTREVTGRFIAAVHDSSDEGFDPDYEPLAGRVQFVPHTRTGVVAYPSLSPPQFVRPEPIDAQLVDGVLMTQVMVGDDVQVQPVRLLVTEDDEAIESWQWEARFSDVRIGRLGEDVKLPAIRFTLTEGTEPLDLTAVVGENTPGGQLVVKGPRGAGITDVTAADGKLVIEWEGGHSREIPVPEAVPGPAGKDGRDGADSTVPGPQGERGLTGPQGEKGEKGEPGTGTIAIDTSAGKAVRADGELISYESGRRDITAKMTSVASGKIYVARMNSLVVVEFSTVRLTKTGVTVDIGTMPTGFGGSGQNLIVDSNGKAFQAYTSYMFNSADLRVRNYNGEILDGLIIYMTKDPPPTVLPGSPG